MTTPLFMRQGLRQRREQARRGGGGRALGGEGEGQTRRQADGRQRARNHRFGKVRAKVEHVFRVVNGMDRPRSRP